MEKTQIIEALSKWNFWSREIDVGIYRYDYLNKLLDFIKEDKVISIVGIRRCGKSYLIKQIAKKLIESGVDKENVLIVNFEEPEFEGTDLQSLQKIYDAYQEIIKPTDKPFIFLDEIQEVPRWEKFVRSLNERKEAFIVISGSSSKLMSDELATILAGRQLYFDILPLVFKEFLGFNGVEARTVKDMLVNSLKIRTLLREYLQFGGYPELVGKSEEFKIRTLRSYFEDILIKDVIKRFKIKEIEKLRALVKFYLTNTSSSITFNSTSSFINLPVETVRRFTSYIETSKSIFFVKRFSFSVKDQEKSARKVYSTDVGLCNAIGFRFLENLGTLAENLVAIELKRRQFDNPHLEFYYWKSYDGKEVDFVIKEGLKVTQLIQVSWDVSDLKTKERETGALVKALKEFRLDEGLIITEDLENEEEVKGKRIIYKPIWKWLLGI